MLFDLMLLLGVFCYVGVFVSCALSAHFFPIKGKDYPAGAAKFSYACSTAGVCFAVVSIIACCVTREPVMIVGALIAFVIAILSEIVREYLTRLSTVN